MAGNGAQRRLPVENFDLLAAGQAAVAVAVSHDHRAAVLDELRERGVVDLAAGHDQTHTEPRLRVRLAALELGERLLEVRQDALVRAHLTHELQHVKFIARDDGVRRLAQVADLGHDAGNFVVVADRRTDRLIGDVNTVGLVQRLEHVHAQLLLIVIDGEVLVRERHVHHAHEKLRVFLLHKAEDLKMLVTAVHHLARLGREQRVEIVITALDAALENAAGVRADLARHVVRAHVDAAGVRRTQAAREAAGQVQQRLRHEIAGVAQGVFPLRLGLLYQLVVGLLQQILKIDQMLQVFHGLLPPLTVRRGSPVLHLVRPEAF